MKFVRLGFVGIAWCLAQASAQTGSLPPDPSVVAAAAAPVPRKSWNTIRRGQVFEPMTGNDRLQFLLRRTVASPGVAGRAIYQAAFDQKANWPEKWGQGWDAFGHRMLFHMARSGVRNVMESGAAAALGYDQRYIRCNCDGVLRRTGHALAMSFVTYNRNGDWVPNIPRISSTVAVEYMMLPLLPDGTRTSGYVSRRLGLYVGTGSLINVWREFSPDIRKRLKRK